MGAIEQFRALTQSMEVERRVEQAQLCVEGQRAWIAAHGDHPHVALAVELLATMEAYQAQLWRSMDSATREMLLLHGHRPP